MVRSPERSMLHALHLALLLVPVAAQDPELPPGGEPSLGPGPWNGDLVLLSSVDGRTFEPFAPLASRAAEVTLAVQATGRVAAVYKDYPVGNVAAHGRLVLRTSDDGGKLWDDAVPFTIQGLPASLGEVHEPCLVARPEGGFRLFFTAYPAGDPDALVFLPGEWPATHSAVSDDGSAWEFEPGLRFGVEGSRVLHPAVTVFAGQWHFVAPVDGRDGVAYHAVSRDGLSFRRLPEIEISGAGPWRGSLVDDNGTLRFFGSGRVGWGASSRDGMRWRLEPRVQWGGPVDTSVVRPTPAGPFLMAGTLRGLRADEDELPEGAAAALLELAGGAPSSGGAAIAANNRFVYVLRGGVLYMFDAQTLKYLRHVVIPEPRGPSTRR